LLNERRKCSRMSWLLWWIVRLCNVFQYLITVMWFMMGKLSTLLLFILFDKLSNSMATSRTEIISLCISLKETEQCWTMSVLFQIRVFKNYKYWFISSWVNISSLRRNACNNVFRLYVLQKRLWCCCSSKARYILCTDFEMVEVCSVSWGQSPVTLVHCDIFDSTRNVFIGNRIADKPNNSEITEIISVKFGNACLLSMLHITMQLRDTV
jgi:hypothetical protein